MAEVKIVVKLGGSLLNDAALLDKMVAQLIQVREHGHEVIVVHGGGKQIKAYLERLQIPSQFHNGLRVTGADTMEVVQMVLAGLVNKMIVSAFARHERSAAGLCGGDGASFIARKFRDPDASAEPFDYGYVGEIYKADPRLVDTLVGAGFFPVIACVGMGEDGAYYNVNADEMAAAVAIFCKAQRLIFVTDVSGVWDAAKQVIPTLDRQQMERLRQTGVISEGMLPKTRACERALENGLAQIHIIGGKEPDGLVRSLLQGESLGTAIH